MKQGRADLHLHSSYSFDSTNSIEVILDQAANYARLDVLALTDHNNMDGVAQITELAPHYGVEIIPGIEINTRQGHLLALFVSEPIPRDLSAAETVYRAGLQGGLCIVPHPTDRYAQGMPADVIVELLQDRDLAQVLVGIEAINMGVPDEATNRLAASLGRQLGLAATGNSDAHVSWTIGSAVTEFPGTTAADLRTALVRRWTTAVQMVERDFFEFYASNIYHFLRRLAGWTVSIERPTGDYVFRRLAEVQG